MIKIDNDLTIRDSIDNELDNNPEYSLEVNPLKKYRISKDQKVFIEYYLEFKSIPLACDLAEISIDDGKKYFKLYSTQQEIRRITKAKYLRQFNTKMMSLQDLGGYLTSIITDNYTTSKDKIKFSDKLKAAQLLVDINKYMSDSIKNPSMIIEGEVKDLEQDIKKLSISSIKSLIKSTKKNDPDKDNIIEEIKDNNLSMEEEAYLKTLSKDELLDMLNKINKDEK